MKTLTSFLIAFTFCCTSVLAQQNDFIIRLKGEKSFTAFQKSFAGLLAHKELLVSSLNIHLFELFSTVEKSQVLQQIQQHPQVLDVMFNEAIESRTTIPNDSEYERQWALEKMDLPEVWSITKGGTTANGDEIVVAIIDTDFSISHEDLAANVWVNAAEIPGNNRDDDGNGLVDDIHGWNFGKNSPLFDNAADSDAPIHGIPVQGIIGGIGNNEIGVTGINWDIKLMLLQYTNNASQIMRGYEYLLEQRRLYNATNGQEGAFVVAMNASWGFATPQLCPETNMWTALHNELGNAGILTAAAVKNEPIDTDIEGDIPSACESDFIISVLNTTQNDQKVARSAFGLTTVDVGAPGDGIRTTRPQDGYMNFDGNSAAAPQIAGAVGILYSVPCVALADLALANPPAAALLIKDAILDGVDISPDLAQFNVTGGRINVFNSVKELQTFCNPDIRPGETFNIISLFPNPADDVIQVAYETPAFEPFQFDIYNTIGQLVRTETVDPCCFKERIIEIDVNDLYSGIYLLVFQFEEETATKRIMVR